MLYGDAIMQTQQHHPLGISLLLLLSPRLAQKHKIKKRYTMGNVSSKTNAETKRLSKKRSSDSQLYESRRRKKKKKELYISVPHDSAHPHVEIMKKYVLQEALGQGHYGIVRKAVNRKTGKLYAVKIIPKWKVENPELVMTEIEILRKLDHPNVVKYIETIEDYDTYYIVMELCNGGELFDRIIDTDHKLSLVRIARITTQILRAVQHCHENGIVNRDIKSENVLFKNTTFCIRFCCAVLSISKATLTIFIVRTDKR